jgi:hypothetical protein
MKGLIGDGEDVYKKRVSTLIVFELLENGRKFNWTMNCEAALQGIKDDLVSARVLIRYDPSLPLSLATDASPIGLGAKLSHKMPDDTEHAISFASRSLSRSEKNYSQIDKAATAIYWGMKKFFQFFYGQKFILKTDDPHLT